MREFCHGNAPASHPLLTPSPVTQKTCGRHPPPCRRGDYHSSDGGEYVCVEQAGLRVERLHPVFSWFGLCVLLRAPKPIDKGRVTGHITRTRDSSMVSPADLAGCSAVPDICNMVILRYLGEASEYGYRTYLGKGRLLRAVS